MRDRIVELYGPRVLRKSALNIRGGAGVFESVLAGKGYKSVLEIGTYRGISAAEISQYCEWITTIDLAFGKLEHNAEIWDRDQFWDNLGIENIFFKRVKDDAEKAMFVNSISFDFAFIDGAHDYESVKRDFELVKRCGRVLFHDADDRGPGKPNDVHNFIRTLPQNEVEYMDIFALWTA